MATPSDPRENFEALFREFFGQAGGPRAHVQVRLNGDLRVRLSLRAREAKRGGSHAVTIERMVRCTACEKTAYRGTARSCGECRDGLVLRTETLQLRVPPGVTPSTVLRLGGKGHEALDRPPGDAYVDLTIERPWWKRETLRPWFGLGALGAVILGAIGATEWWDKHKLPDVGASCRENRDCRSGECLALYQETPMVDLSTLGFEGGAFRGPATRGGGVCTHVCKVNDDCPASMTCAPIERRATYPGAPDLPVFGAVHPNALACAPREN